MIHSIHAHTIIKSLTQKCSSLVHSKDLAGVTTMHTTTARVFPPGGKKLQGHAEVQAYYQALFEQNRTGVSFETVEAHFLGRAHHPGNWPCSFHLPRQ